MTDVYPVGRVATRFWRTGDEVLNLNILRSMGECPTCLEEITMSRPVLRAALGALSIGALIAGAVALDDGPASASPATDSESWLVSGNYDFVVPAGVTSVTIEVAGAQGGDGWNTSGGLGGYMAGDFTVVPGETLKVHVGGAGAVTAVGGANGGGDADPGGCGGVFDAGSGGGGTDVRTSDDALADRIIVAGGGGGGGGLSMTANGGVGGGNTPTAGASDSSFGGFDGGQPGTSSAGGAGGGSGMLGGQAGALGVGGAAGTDGCTVAGGGGGGYYGGGGGESSFGDGTGGGGGGSAYIDPGADLTGAADGVESGDGQATITWVVPMVTTTTEAPTTTTTTAPSTTTTTTAPAPEPAPRPKVVCPAPVPPLRVFNNAFSLGVAKYLIDNCGVTGRATAVGGEAFWVLDPPSASACPTWRAVRVVASRNSLLIAKHLIDNCQFSVRGQMEGKTGAIYVVPDGYPVGARITAS